MTPIQNIPSLFSSGLLIIGIISYSMNFDLFVKGLSLSDSGAYSAWSFQHGNDYEHSSFLGNDNEVAVHWKINDKILYLAAAVEANGWLGIGIAESGGMPGADIAMFTASDNKLVDYHALSYSRPIEDKCQDWTLVRSIVKPGLIIFEAKRDLSTGDPQDRKISNDSDQSTPSHRLIAAWGDNDDVTYHGANTATGQIRFFGKANSRQDIPLVQPKQSEIVNAQTDSGEVDLLVNKYVIPEDETTYADFCFSLNELEAQGLPKNSTVHMIGAEHIADMDTVSYVHHIILWGSTDHDACKSYKESMIYAWAPGAETLTFPSEVGIPLGELGYKSFRFTVHYNNPENIPNNVDNSGVRLMYTSNLRKYDAAIMATGDPLVSLEGQIVGTAQYDFSCPSSCTQKYLRQDVTVFQESMHMHQSGLRMVNKQIREGQVLRQATVDFFDYKAQGVYSSVQESFVLKSGDSFETSCYFEDGEDTNFGFGTQDEMCITFLYYYPAMPNFHGFCGYDFFDEKCSTTLERKDIDVNVEGDLNRSFGIEIDSCPIGLEDFPDSSAVRWGVKVVAGVVVSLLVYVLEL